MNQPLVIVKAQPEDAALIVDVARKTFVDTYTDLGIRNNMGKYMEEYFTVGRITEELRRDDLHFYIALMDEKPIGFTKLRNDRMPKGISGKNAWRLNVSTYSRNSRETVVEAN